MLLKLVHEQQGDPADRNRRTPDEAAARTLPKICPGHQSARNEQQCEDRRDNSGRDVPLGEIDGVEVDRELRKPEEQRRKHARAIQFEAFALPGCHQRHRSRRDDEPVGHRPLRWNGAELIADDDPGRSPDGREDDEGERDLGEGPALFGHRVAIAVASCSTGPPPWSQLVTKRISPGPQS